MNGSLMYEVARMQVAEQRRAAREAGEAQRRRAAARGWRARLRRAGRSAAAEEAALPRIPDYAHELLGVVPGRQPESADDAGKRAGR